MVSMQTLLDFLEIPQRQRISGTYRHLAKVMAELGWTAVRVRDFTRGGYKEQVCGRRVPRSEHLSPQDGLPGPSEKARTRADLLLVRTSKPKDRTLLQRPARRPCELR